MNRPPHSSFNRATKLSARLTAIFLAASLWGGVTATTAAATPGSTDESVPSETTPTQTPAPAPAPTKPAKKKKKSAPKKRVCDVAFVVKLGTSRKGVNKRVNRKLKAQTGKKCKAQRKTKKVIKPALKKPCVASVVVKASHNKKATKKRTKNQRKKVMRQHKVCATHKQKQRRAALPNRAMKVARAQLGDPYRYGGTGPNAFDCSGLTSFSYARAGKSIPRTTGAQRSATRHIARKDARVGDLVFFHSGSGVYHVGLYAGGNKVLHAPRTGSNVRYENIWTSSVSFGRV